MSAVRSTKTRQTAASSFPASPYAAIARIREHLPHGWRTVREMRLVGLDGLGVDVSFRNGQNILRHLDRHSVPLGAWPEDFFALFRPLRMDRARLFFHETPHPRRKLEPATPEELHHDAAATRDLAALVAKLALGRHVPPDELLISATIRRPPSDAPNRGQFTLCCPFDAADPWITPEDFPPLRAWWRALGAWSYGLSRMELVFILPTLTGHARAQILRAADKAIRDLAAHHCDADVLCTGHALANYRRGMRPRFRSL